MDKFIEAFVTLQHFCWQYRPDCKGCPFYDLKNKYCILHIEEVQDLRIDAIRDTMYNSIWSATLHKISELMPKSIKDDIERSLINDCYRKED